MRNDVWLLSGEDRDPSLLSDLIRVFRQVQEKGATPLGTQLYFNSWFIHSLFDNPDVNTQLTLRQYPGIVGVAYERMQAALQPDAYFPHLSPDKDTIKILRGQKLLLRFALRKLEQSTMKIPTDVLDRAKIAVRFNDYTDNERDARRATQKQGQKVETLSVRGTGPFVPAYVSAHLLDIIAQRMHRVCRTAHLHAVYSAYLVGVSHTLPLYSSAHEAGERPALRAVETLRNINKQMQTILREKNTSQWLPFSAKAERQLIDEIFIYTKAYRDYSAPSPKPAVLNAVVLPFARPAKKEAERRPNHP